MKKCMPTYKNIMSTDWSVFLTIFGYMGLVSFLGFLIAKAEYPFSGYDFIELIAIIFYFLLGAALTTPIGLWWCYVTRRTFNNGIVIKAKITEYFGARGPYVGIYYTFNFEGKEYAQSATLLNKKIVRNLLKSENVSIVFDKKRKISFIYDLYCKEGIEK